MIDIICAYVDGNDSNWQIDYLKHFKVNKPQRYRDYGTFKFLIRSIFFNCPFINNVFIVVHSESQIPKWLNINNPRIKIVFHKDYIPDELLPCFNSNVIELFYHKIPELSEKFILANDDMIFLKPALESEWFIDNNPQQFISFDKNYVKKKGIFADILDNDIRYSNLMCNTESLLIYKNNHLPIPYLKSTWKEVWNSNFKLLYDSISVDKGRSSKNISNWIFNYIQIMKGISKHNKSCEHSGYILLKDELDTEKFHKILNMAKVACFNDGIKSNLKVFELLNNRLSNILPDKSDFEI